MKNKIFLLSFMLFTASQLIAVDKPAILDQCGALNEADKNRILEEGRTIISNHKVNGQDLLIQIDFMSESEFDYGGVTGRDKNTGRTLFSRGTYANWSVKYSSQPAVLILFIDQGNQCEEGGVGNYKLDALNFSNMLMKEGIPDLVRRYIRDEIMKKESSYVEIISSGLYAIEQALNPIYKERLIREHVTLFSGNHFKRRYSYFFPFNYYEFTPYHDESANDDLLPDILYFVDNNSYLDWSEIEYSSTEKLDISKTYSGSTPWYDKYFEKEINVPILRDIIDNSGTAEENEQLITNLFREDLINICNDPLHYLNEDLESHDPDLLNLAFNGKYPGVNRDHRLDRFGCRIKVKKKILDKQWEYIPDVINRAIYSGWGPKGPTWCNQYGRALTGKVFGSPIFASMSANELSSYMLSKTEEYIRLPVDEDPHYYVNRGFMVYFVWNNSEGHGHFETGIPSGIQSIDSDYSSVNLSHNLKYTVGAGASAGAKTTISNDLKYDRFLYLGYLKK